ncbi:MAG TPA: hypothetical protein VFO16_04830 [Pseudonocardiaceae bacterium]|nr:hypothetical protein [Pseudonocardiaceae bacterium]
MSAGADVARAVDGAVVGLLLRAVEVAGPYRWRWLLVDERSGAALADHQVELDPAGSETEAFGDLYRFLRWRADPDRRVASEAELVGRVGAWIGLVALGESVGRAIVAAAPVTVRVQVLAGAEFLAFRPWELAHVGGVPLAVRGDVALVYDLPGSAGVTKVPVGMRCGCCGVQPADGGLRVGIAPGAVWRERYELSRLVRRVAARAGRRVELEVAQYGVSRAVLADLVESGDGWDVLHLPGHGGAARLPVPDQGRGAVYLSRRSLLVRNREQDIRQMVKALRRRWPPFVLRSGDRPFWLRKVNRCGIYMRAAGSLVTRGRADHWPVAQPLRVSTSPG